MALHIIFCPSKIRLIKFVGIVNTMNLLQPKRNGHYNPMFGTINSPRYEVKQTLN